MSIGSLEPQNHSSELKTVPQISAVEAMNIHTDRLESWKQIAQIISALAIPLVLALIGFYVQRSLAESGLKKDYVQMALSVLSEPPTKQNEQLRKWAIAVLDKNSPVTIPIELKSQLVVESFVPFFTKAQIETKIVCKSVPSPEMLEWLIELDPSRFTSCPNGQIGIRTWSSVYFNKPKEESQVQR